MQEYTLHHQAHLGACMDIAIHKNRIYIIQNTRQYKGGRLCVLTPDFELLASFEGIGNARQIAIAGDAAIVTAREDGMWIFDVSQPTPVLYSHYQTLEYATGATLYANLALISCRQFGVEIIYIADPANPKHVGIIRIGEVQSACVCDGFLYGGVWGAMNVAVVDIRDIHNPRLVSSIPLDGRGDGVLALDGRLYAVTGQHRRGIENIMDENDPCFGMGNGLSVYDVSDPSNAKLIHREFFGKCYNMSFDMWKPALCGDAIICGCSSLGVFAYDKENFAPLFRLRLPHEEAVTSFASLDQRLYVCGAQTDLYYFDAQQPLGTCRRWDEEKQICTFTGQRSLLTEADGMSLLPRYQPDSAPVLALSVCGDTLAAACGAGGLHLLDEELHLISKMPTRGFCCDVKGCTKFVAAALADEGLRVWRRDGEKLECTFHLSTEAPALQLCLSADERYLLCGCGTNDVLMFDMSNPDEPRQISQIHIGFPLYGSNFSAHAMADGTMFLFWHRAGLVYTNPSKGDFAFHNIFFKRSKGFTGFGPESGCDTDGEHILYSLNGGYVFLPLRENVNVDELPLYHADAPLPGKFVLMDGRMIFTERARGLITVADAADVTRPRIIAHSVTPESPGRPVMFAQKLLMPLTYGGIAELQLSDSSEKER